MRRLALVVIAGFALAGCGGSSKSSTTNSTANAQAQIRSAYEQLFSPTTSLADRIAVLQDGSKFKTVVAGFASNPLAKKVRVVVSKVQPHGADQATVVYTVKFGGTSLPTQKGSAVLQNGSWKVGFASLCKLVALGGSTPSACKS